MPRDPQFLTDATKRTFRVGDDATVKRVAAGWDKSQQYVYQIADAEKSDPFCAFVQMYEGLLRGGVSTEHYDRELAFIRVKHDGGAAGHECPSTVINEKYRCFSEFIDLFMRYLTNDGVLDLAETDHLLEIHPVLSRLVTDSGKALLAHKARLEGVRVEITEGNIRAVATDGYRLPVADCAIDAAVEPDAFTIPTRAITELLKLDAGEVGIGSDKNHIFIESESQLFVSRRIDADFVAYQKMLPTDERQGFVVDADEIREAVRRASFMAGDLMSAVALEAIAGQVIVRSITGDVGEAEEHVAAAYAGDPIILGFKIDQLFQVLGVLDGPVRFAFKDETAPILVTPENTDKYQCVICLANVDIIRLQTERKREAASA